MITDAEFCARVCRIAREQGYTLDRMGSFQGCSFAFVKNGKRVPGSIQRDQESALVHACQELLPHIYLHLFSK